MTEQLAVIYGHDDQVLAEFAMPRVLHELRFPRRTSPSWGEPEPFEPVLIEVDIYVPDFRESTLMQLGYQNPNVWAYRKQITT